MTANIINLSGIGVDILELKRLGKISNLLRFAEYFLNPSEIEVFKKSCDPINFIASRFAVKEAVIKAFPGSLRPHDFLIKKDGVKPVVCFLSPLAKNYKAFISISHSTQYVVGYAAVIRT
ncbi:MAG: 4'-phosphopantetheinyl transferase superfamily protein [Patescibacteria group bacterium]